MKRKIYIKILIFILLTVLIFAPMESVFAIESTTYTYTVSTDGTYIRTQDAYMSGGIYLDKVGLKSPEDFCLNGGFMYIADTGNARIVKYELSSGKVTILGEGLMSKPTGIDVGKDGKIYVADYDAKEILILNANGELNKTISRPQTPLYGNGAFSPQKVGVDSFDNFYCVSEGTYEGVLQFNSNGEFNGYFGANRTKSKLTLKEWIQETFYTEAQKSKLALRTPPTIANLDVADSDLLYTVTQLDEQNSVKMLNMAGINILNRQGRLWDENYYTDVAVTKNGTFFAVTDTGSIEEFDNEGWIMLLFGGRASSSDRNGLTTVVSAIEVDDNYNVYLLDKERALVQAYYPTEYAGLVHQANEYYSAGHYDKSLSSWEQLLQLNSRARLAHNGYAKTLFQLGRYEEASSHFKLIYDQEGYSDCFWEQRTIWARKNLYTMVAIIIVAVAVFFVLSLVRKKRDFLAPVTGFNSSLKIKYSLYKNLTTDVAYMIKHPIDCLDEIKIGKRGSVAAAGILYATAFFIRIVCSALTAFSFNTIEINKWMNPLTLALSISLPIILYIVGNYMIASINDGEGSVKGVFVGCAYAFSAYIVFTPMVTILTHVLTLTERFIVEFPTFLILAYTLILFFLTAKEIHAYSFKNTVKNIILTLFFVVLSVLALFILYALLNEVFSFIGQFFEEVKYRVFS